MRILLVDDDVVARELLTEHLEKRLGHQVTPCANGLQALELFRESPFPMVLSDIRMPRMSGIALLQGIKALEEGKTADTVLLTGYGNMNTAIQALRAGAYDYLLKPVNLVELEAVVLRIAEHQALLRSNDELTHHFECRLAEATSETQSRFEQLRKAYAEVMGIGRLCVCSRQMHEVMALAERLHEDRSVPVLVEGETGTGKELVARFVHYGREAATTPFVSINCSAIAPNLFESELFGYEGGAFSGAKRMGQMGKLELAQGGTLLLDEIGDLPLEMQPKLLRVVQEREFYRVGGLRKINLDVRIVCVTNRNLARLVRENGFRQDLFFRLNTGRIFIPPLRERRDDIAPLAELFLEQYAAQKKRRFKAFQEETLKVLHGFDWPGNVRQLQNAVERIVLLNDEEQVRPEHLAFLSSVDGEENPAQFCREELDCLTITFPPEGLELKEIEMRVIHKVLSIFGGNKTRAAAYLGMARNSIRSWIDKG
ncbi:sigma-54 dependent transcriptional regulator [bacterium]|nr:sigma-54 dependent transcriptional regulator [bacterium]